jgi:hypothetical protein
MDKLLGFLAGHVCTLGQRPFEGAKRRLRA